MKVVLGRGVAVEAESATTGDALAPVPGPGLARQKENVRGCGNPAGTWTAMPGGTGTGTGTWTVHPLRSRWLATSTTAKSAASCSLVVLCSWRV